MRAVPSSQLRFLKYLKTENASEASSKRQRNACRILPIDIVIGQTGGVKTIV
jgi:hypothetical protein